MLIKYEKQKSFCNRFYCYGLPDLGDAWQVLYIVKDDLIMSFETRN